ncbi:hypothetical protein LTS02_011514 [Friedmanniomyces endolithicus]|nr:hypothetical protein LTS02_011514 [Friedmanniomyces endolithicus]
MPDEFVAESVKDAVERMGTHGAIRTVSDAPQRPQARVEHTRTMDPPNTRPGEPATSAAVSDAHQVAQARVEIWRRTQAYSADEAYTLPVTRIPEAQRLAQAETDALGERVRAYTARGDRQAVEALLSGAQQAAAARVQAFRAASTAAAVSGPDHTPVAVSDARQEAEARVGDVRQRTEALVDRGQQRVGDAGVPGARQSAEAYAPASRRVRSGAVSPEPAVARGHVSEAQLTLRAPAEDSPKQDSVTAVPEARAAVSGIPAVRRPVRARALHFAVRPNMLPPWMEDPVNADMTVPRELVVGTPNREGTDADGVIDTFLLQRRQGPVPYFTAPQRRNWESQRGTNLRVAMWRREQGIVWPPVVRQMNFEVDHEEDAWQEVLREHREVQGHQDRPAKRPPEINPTMETTLARDAEQLLAQTERFLIIKGHLFLTHEPQRSQFTIPSRIRIDLPPSLALYPNIDPEHCLRDHDEEVASLKACIDAHTSDTRAAAHNSLDVKYGLLDATRQVAGYAKLDLYQKLVALRREQGREQQAHGDLTFIAIMEISTSGLPRGQQGYYLSPTASWFRMQEILEYATQRWRSFGAWWPEGSDPETRECDPRWTYQLGADAVKKVVWPLATEEAYACLRKRMRLEGTSSVILWPDELWDESARTRAKAGENLMEDVQDEEREREDWAAWGPIDEVSIDGDTNADMVDAEVAERTEMDSERLSGCRQRGSSDSLTTNAPAKGVKPQGRKESGSKSPPTLLR